GELAGPPAGAPGPARDSARVVVGRYAVPLILLASIVLFSFLRPETFFTVGNFKTILVTQAVLVVLTLGVMLPLAAGEYDLSVAAVLGFSATLIAYLTTTSGWSPIAAIAFSLLVALAIGATNAIFVVHFGVNSFIATLGISSLVTGIATAIVGPTTIGGVPSAVTALGRTELLGFGLPIFLALALGVLLWFVLENTPNGRYLFFTGEGRDAARLAGVRVNRIRFVVFLLSAVLAWFAGLLLLGQTGSANTTYGTAFLLPAFAAAFLGATTIRVGRYNVWGCVLAVYLLETGTTGLELLGAAYWVSDVFNGAALVLAVTFARAVSRERST
ncbi:MAG: Ribose transporter, permease protein, partial [Solirubrobacterales bacterium]|nr:Ribose transporter, permease protein [Solirubrobacterales bacterium]